MLLSYVCEHCQCTFTIPSDHPRRYGRIYCSRACYHQARRKPLAERFWSYVLKTETCWLWQAARYTSGYGAFTLTSTTQVTAHRLAYELTYGMILPGLCCLHACDNPPCVRPDHLFLGTFSDNTRDMLRKQRGGVQTHPERLARGAESGSARHPGEESPNAKLTDNQIQAIRHLYATESVTQKQIAASFGVTQATICRILTRQSWRHLP